MSRPKTLLSRGAKELALLALGLLFSLPIFLLFVNSFKTQRELVDAFFALPKQLVFSNYVEAWNNMNYPRAFANTVIVTAATVSLIVLFCSMAAYKIGRSRQKWATYLLLFFSFSMMLPFQTIMIPLMQVIAALGLSASLPGFILAATALFAPFTIYLYRGFYSSIPRELEEAARIDGANAYQTFFRVVFPLLKPATVTVIIINVMNVWNDYVLSMLVLQKQAIMTLQLSVVQYNGRYHMEWNLTLATLAIVITPVIILYLLMQNQIQSGMIAGSLKG